MIDIKPSASYRTALDVMTTWQGDVLSGKPPTFYRVGDGDLARLEVGPGLVTLIGGAPGAGKTAFIMQCVIDALRLNPDLRACVCNVEMPAQVLLDRQLSRLSGIDLKAIRYRQFNESYLERVVPSIERLRSIADRLCFVSPPFNLFNIAATADDFGADLLVLDYVQRISPLVKFSDKRGSVDATMNSLRQFADAGMAVIVVAAVSRTKDSRGRSSYAGDGLNLASFRESSELEFGADDAFILVPHSEDEDLIVMKHLKARHTEARDLELRFIRHLQRFESIPTLSQNPFTESDWPTADDDPRYNGKGKR